LQGWLGSASPEEFAIAVGEADLPCHKTIDYDDPSWRETQLPLAAMCAGALILTKNQGKIPRDPGLAAAVQRVRKDTVRVFAWAFEFIQHHNSGEFKSWNPDEFIANLPPGSKRAAPEGTARRS
jgi:hypothetical protein